MRLVIRRLKGLSPMSLLRRKSLLLSTLGCGCLLSLCFTWRYVVKVPWMITSIQSESRYRLPNHGAKVMHNLPYKERGELQGRLREHFRVDADVASDVVDADRSIGIPAVGVRTSSRTGLVPIRNERFAVYKDRSSEKLPSIESNIAVMIDSKSDLDNRLASHKHISPRVSYARHHFIQSPTERFVIRLDQGAYKVLRFGFEHNSEPVDHSPRLSQSISGLYP